MRTKTLRVIAIIAASFLSLAAFSKEKGPAKINIISYNLRNSGANDGTNSWMYRFPATIMMVEDQKPDVMGVQEMLPDQRNLLVQELIGYKMIGVCRDDGKKEGEIMGIFYNKKKIKLQKWGTFWLSETPEVPSKGWDGGCFRTATWALFKDKSSGKKFYMINTHLDNVGIKARAKGLQLIIDRISGMDPSGTTPMILCGDFNTDQKDKAINVLDPVMTNARLSAPKTDKGITYNAWGRVAEQSTIDYIFYRGFSGCPVFEVIRKEYFSRRFISDHHPIRAELLF